MPSIRYTPEGHPEEQDMRDILDYVLDGEPFSNIATFYDNIEAKDLTRWLITYPQFREAYRRAQQARAEINLGDLTSISADDEINDKALLIHMKVNSTTASLMAKLIENTPQMTPRPLIEESKAEKPLLDIASIHKGGQDGQVSNRGEVEEG